MKEYDSLRSTNESLKAQVNAITDAYTSNNTAVKLYIEVFSSIADHQ